MKRILLLKPYRPERLFVTTPPQGLMTVAAWLRREAERRGDPIELKILDLNPHRQMTSDVLPEVLEFRPDLIGLSCLSCESDACQAMSAALKAVLPDVPIILGGPFPSHDPEEALKDRCVDYIVKGEGELTFDELVQVLLSGGDPETVDGVGFRRGEENVYTAERAFIPDLDVLPLPAYDLVDVQSYFHTPRHSRIKAHPEYTTLVSTRGCPYQCIYCHVIMGKKTRFRSAEKVVDEIEYLVKHYGIREVQWADDIWNLDKKRSKKICDLILERGLKIRMAYPNGVRGDIIDEELLDKMKAAGTYHISFAPETGSPRMQKVIKKHAKLDVLQKVISSAARRKIWCHGFFMVGFPTEREEDLRMTFDYALASKLHSASFFIVNAHKGTKLHDMAEEMGLNVDFQPGTHSYMNPDFQLSEVPTKKLRRMLLVTYARFFTSPTRMWRILQAVPSKKQMGQMAWELVHRLTRQLRLGTADIYQSEGVPDYEKRELAPVAPYNTM